MLSLLSLSRWRVQGCSRRPGVSVPLPPRSHGLLGRQTGRCPDARAPHPRMASPAWGSGAGLVCLTPGPCLLPSCPARPLTHCSTALCPPTVGWYVHVSGFGALVPFYLDASFTLLLGSGVLVGGGDARVPQAQRGGTPSHF